mgnify:CR=1 FL=1|tara:strand:+ start:681 stop:896 length:216 start_codon:yes stop_codon:yes gene_type:complete
MSDDLVTRLRMPYDQEGTTDKLEMEAADEIERLREWKELAYEMRNRSWWAMRNKVLVKFDDMHKSDWKRHE